MHSLHTWVGGKSKRLQLKRKALAVISQKDK